MKQVIIHAVIEKLKQELARQTDANIHSNTATAFSAANAEKQRDTTGYEAAFLARGYAQHCLNLASQIKELKTMSAEDFRNQEIDIGASVEVELENDIDTFLLLPCGGGIEVEVDHKKITVITPDSPIGRALMGNIEAGFFELPSGIEGIIRSVR